MSQGALKALRRGDTDDDDEDDDDDEGDDDKEMFNAVWAKVLSRHWKEVKDSDKDDDIEGWQWQENVGSKKWRISDMDTDTWYS